MQNYMQKLVRNGMLILETLLLKMSSDDMIAKMEPESALLPVHFVLVMVSVTQDNQRPVLYTLIASCNTISY